jgi:hypothetical protein
MSTQLHGTWRFVKCLDRDGKEEPNCPRNSYTFNPDGSASFDLPDGPKLPMRWKIIEGRLRIEGAGGGKGQGTVRFELPEPNVLVMYGRNDTRAVFERVPDREVKPGWLVRSLARGKQLSYEDGERTCRFNVSLEQGRLVLHAYKWTDAQRIEHELTPELRQQVVPRVVDYLQRGGWRDKVDLLLDPPP